jgi:biopolymer transport protein ExbB
VSSWILIVEWVARLILLMMLGLSIWSIAIIIERRKFFKNLEELEAVGDGALSWITQGMSSELKAWAHSNQSLRAGIIREALKRNQPDQIEKAVSSFWAEERIKLEKGLAVLGTLGSTTPFVGLLGTILGIIVAFGALSSGQLDSQKVMYALAEALVLTAVGLAVAIPAVIAFNFFSRKILTIQRKCESVKDLYIAYLKD